MVALEKEVKMPSKWACEEEQMLSILVEWPQTWRHCEGPPTSSAAGKGPEQYLVKQERDAAGEMEKQLHHN